ncbi:MAG: carboxylesterase/lipase family protein, partial [Stellaceae bacterium]
PQNPPVGSLTGEVPLAHDEDCLTLNVWTPAADGAKRPVLVWIHGGGFTSGSGSEPLYSGAALARRGDVVVVTINYRLGILGFLAHPGLADEESGGARGNWGLLDKAAALRWVRDNIGAFGGDPGNVTIFGESGGGGKVSVLMAMPEARGLFHRAIVQSGATIRVSTRERAVALADAVLKEFGFARGDCARLQDVPLERLLAAIAPASREVGPTRWRLLDRYDFGPVVDGADLPAQPFDPAAPGIADDIPLLIGGAHEESAFFLADDDEVWHGRITDETLRRRVAAIAGDHVDRVLAAYPHGTPGDRLIAALTGSNFWIRTVMLAERKAARAGLGAGTAPVYMYSLDWQSPAHGGRLKAHHAMDLPFVFDNTDVPDTTKGAAGAAGLAAVMSAVWAQFARSGSPQTAALPAWPAYISAERATMVFDTACCVAQDPDRDARAAWAEVIAAAP